MNRLTIIGNVCNDPELRSTTDGKSVCNFNVAVNRKKKTDGTQEADFFRVTAWSALGELCAKYLAKGRKVAVIGSVSVHPYKDKSDNPRATIEVLAVDVEFLSAKNDDTDKETGYVKVNEEDCPY